jgi:hypothetical protein
MRTQIKVLSLVGPLLHGCAAIHVQEAKAGDVAKAAAVTCYVTSGGIEVASQVGRCPDQKLVEAEVASFVGRMGAPGRAFDGIKLVFVPYWMQCGGVMTYGCTRGKTILVSLAGEGGRLVRPTGSEFPDEAVWQRGSDWRGTFVHEMGHALRSMAGLSTDGTHADRWWWAVAENRSKSTPAFSADDSRALAIRSVAVHTTALAAK